MAEYKDYHLNPQAGRFVKEDGSLVNLADVIGHLLDGAITDPTNITSSILSFLKGIIKQLQGNGSGSAPVDMATALSSEYDTIDVNKMGKGGVTVAHSAITGTATSGEIDCRGFNTISVECAVSAITSGNWLIELLGCAVSMGVFGNCYAPKDDGTYVQQKTPSITANGNYHYYFTGIPNYIQIKATRTTDGTLTCKVTPMNL